MTSITGAFSPAVAPTFNLPPTPPPSNTVIPTPAPPETPSASTAAPSPPPAPSTYSAVVNVNASTVRGTNVDTTA